MHALFRCSVYLFFSLPFGVGQFFLHSIDRGDFFKYVRDDSGVLAIILLPLRGRDVQIRLVLQKGQKWPEW